MTETADQVRGQNGTKYCNRGGGAGPVTRMTRDQTPTGRWAANPLPTGEREALSIGPHLDQAGVGEHYEGHPRPQRAR